MKSLVLCLSFGLLFLASLPINASADSVKAVFDDEATGYRFFNTTIKNSFNLTCVVTLTPQRAYRIEWLKLAGKNDTEWTLVTSLPNPERYTLTPDNELLIKFPEFSDAGTYRCRLADSPSLYAEVKVASAVRIVKFPEDVMAIEGEKLTIVCNAKGLPKPEVDWVYVNSSMNVTYTESSERVNLTANEEGVPNAVLTISPAERSDAGTYMCRASNEAGTTNATTTVRVKDKYAALWPFLGICAEVFILCAVILVYEKRRNLPAASAGDDSDTDHSPDRKK